MRVRKTSVPGLPLKRAIAMLANLYPVPEVMRDPLSLILWENIGYLIDDAKRAPLFAEFAARVGLEAAAIARARADLLYEIAKQGGMRPETRVERWRRIAQLVLTDCDGDLDRKLRSLTLPKARTLLKKFPTIGDPGADRILLFCDIAPLPAIDSNGLRALVRLGYCTEGSSYSKSYKVAVAAIASARIRERDRLVTAFVVLRAHGQTLCKRAAPLCMACPLDPHCAHAPARAA